MLVAVEDGELDARGSSPSALGRIPAARPNGRPEWTALALGAAPTTSGRGSRRGAVVWPPKSWHRPTSGLRATRQRNRLEIDSGCLASHKRLLDRLDYHY